MSTYHELKTWPKFFESIIAEMKTFEIRKNDRDFKAGDYLVLREWNPETAQYTGRVTVKFVSYLWVGDNVIDWEIGRAHV